MKVADKTYYLNADQSEALPAKARKKSDGEAFDETPDGAAYVLVREGQEVTAEMAEKYGVEGVEQEEAKPEAGVVLSDVDGEQGFVAAGEVQKAGGVVTDAPKAEEAPKASAKKAAGKSKK